MKQQRNSVQKRYEEHQRSDKHRETNICYCICFESLKHSRTYGNPIMIHDAFQLPEQKGMPAIEVLAHPTAKTA